MKRVAVLVSGGGTNLQALLDAAARGEMPHAEIALVLSSKPGVQALRRAKDAGVPTCVIKRAEYSNNDMFSAKILSILRENNIDIVVLAGFLCILGGELLEAYNGSIVNVHPSLIPAFCGEGWYGLRVHEGVLARGVKVTGATVHLVDDVVDSGKILLQKAVEVKPADTPETLQRRVMEEAEWQLLPLAVEMLCAET